MNIPKICCDKCGHVYSVSIREGLTDKGQRESYLAIDPEHICVGGYEMRLEKDAGDTRL